MGRLMSRHKLAKLAMLATVCIRNQVRVVPLLFRPGAPTSPPFGVSRSKSSGLESPTWLCVKIAPLGHAGFSPCLLIFRVAPFLATSMAYSIMRIND